MKNSEALAIQRQALLGGKWVARNPVRDGEACLVVRLASDRAISVFDYQLDGDSISGVLRRAIAHLYPDSYDKTVEMFKAFTVTGWNDHFANPGEAEAVLEYAERLAKEIECESSTPS